MRCPQSRLRTWCGANPVNRKGRKNFILVKRHVEQPECDNTAEDNKRQACTLCGQRAEPSCAPAYASSHPMERKHSFNPFTWVGRDGGTLKVASISAIISPLERLFHIPTTLRICAR